MQLPQRTEALLLLLDRMIELLEWDRHTFWLERTRDAVALLHEDKRAGFTLFLSGFGTAGSFNECSVGKGEWNGNVHTWSPGHEAKYKEFESLKNESYGLARELERESEPPLFVSLKAIATRTTIRTRLLLAVLGVLLVAAVAWALR
jgi:hypothetical protein